jgi:hypothetical protein
MKDSLLLSEDDDDDNDDEGSDSEIERITNVKEDENESSRPISLRNGEQAKSPFSQLFSNQKAQVATTVGGTSSKNKSDSDDDEFIAMLKRK